MKRIVSNEAYLPMALGAICGVVFIVTEASAGVVYTTTMVVAAVSALAYSGYLDRLLPPRWRRR